METLQGQFLVAMPMMEDERFVESVLLVVEHNSEGAMAIAINEKLPTIKFGDVFNDIMQKLKPTQSELKISNHMISQPVLRGGPVQTQRGFLLHYANQQIEGISFPVNSEISLSASIETLQAVATGKRSEKTLFALGYCGWHPGQLENELIENVWLSVPYSTKLLFDVAFENRYDFALEQLGINRANLSAFSGKA